MKKLVMLAATLAVVLAVAAPAIAQVNQGEANRSTTGDVTTTGTVASKGDNSDQCVQPLQFGNAGAQQNSQGLIQYESTAKSGPRISGGKFGFTPKLTAPCTQAVEQSSAATSGG